MEKKTLSSLVAVFRDKECPNTGCYDGVPDPWDAVLLTRSPWSMVNNLAGDATQNRNARDANAVGDEVSVEGFFH